MVDARVAKGQKTQEKLIEALIDLAAEGGLQGVSAGKLAKKAGVSTSTIFHHFSSIEALSLEAMRRWFDQTLGEMKRVPRESLTLEAYLELMSTASFEMANDTRPFRATMAFLHRAIYDAQYQAALAPFLHGYAQEQCRLLAELSGRRPDDPKVKALSRGLAACLDGLALQWAITKDIEGCKAAFSAMAKGVVAQLQSSKKETRS